MGCLKHFALIALLIVPLGYLEAQVSIGVGFGPAYIYGPPACEDGYYGYYPYACAPYGYYGSDWFANGVFIGAGPWWGWRRGFDGRRFGRDFDRRGFDRHFDGRGFGRGGVRGFRGGPMGGFHGGRGFRGSGGFHGGGGGHR